MVDFRMDVKGREGPEETTVDTVVSQSPDAAVRAGGPPWGRGGEAVPSWEETFGRGWQLQFLFLAAGLVMAGAFVPLMDPDLGMHLATGEWIVRNQRVPTVEPFAWTRAGAPYFAYSWLAEVIYYRVHQAVGPVGLRLLQGTLLLFVASAAVGLGQAMRWKPSVTFFVAALSTWVAVILTGSLRPQIILFIVVPLLWACVHRLTVEEGSRWHLFVILLLSALCANTHLFFPVTIMPAVAGLVIANKKRVGVAVVAVTMAGWLLSPYAMHWPEVFALFFGRNALLTPPSPVVEFRAGFVDFVYKPLLLVLPVLALSLLPFGFHRIEYPSRAARVGWMLLWIGGLIAFGFGVRLLAIWWIAMTPMVGAILNAIVRRDTLPPRPAVRWATSAIVLGLLCVQIVVGVRRWPAEGDVHSRRLGTRTALPAEALAAWLQSHTAPRSGGKVFTIFNYGSYLTWRLPGYSMSIDGRTIFPDSVARAEVYVLASSRNAEMGPWRSADIAIVPTRRRVSDSLDSSDAWARVATAVVEKPLADTAALWVRTEWWARHGTTALPATPEILQIDPRWP